MNKCPLLKRSFVTISVAVGLLCASAWRAQADFVQTDLVSDIAGLAAITDPSLINPWGVSHTATSPFWTSNQGTNTATLFAVTGSTNVAKVNINPPFGFVAIPTTASGPQGPTGTVANTNASSFLVGNGGDGFSAHFIFANLNGTISAWDTGTAAFTQATTPGAIYTGLSINQAQNQLYAVNNAGTGGINVFSSSFAPVSLGAGAFATPTVISALGLVPFNVRDINGSVYVTYAPAGHLAQTSATPGMGAVAVFSESGTLLRTMTTPAAIAAAGLAAPWGITLAPASFGPFGNDLLVGNFSYGHSSITALDPITLAFLGSIMIDVGSGNTPGGLWSLDFGIGGNNGSPNTLYFTDGIDGETHGLFGAINPIPLPAALPLFATGLGVLSLLGWRRKRKNAAVIAA
jgi:uncharacterized protein (TIGR03118 family)